MLSSFVLVVYAARILGASDFGKYALVRGYFELFLSICATGLSILLTRDIAKDTSRINQYLTTSTTLVVALALLASGVVMGIAHLFDYAHDTRVAIYLACLALVPAAISELREATFLAVDAARYISYGTLAENLLRTAASLVALYLGYGVQSLFVILLVTRVVLLLFYLSLCHGTLTHAWWGIDWNFLRQLIRTWKVFAIENWLSNIFSSLDLIVLSFFHREAAVGTYSAAYRVMNLAGAFATSYTSAVFPTMSRLYSISLETFRRIGRDSIRYIVMLLLPAAFIIAALADSIITLLYTRAYSDAVAILWVLIWVLLPRFLNPFLSHVLFARGDQRQSLKVAAIALALYMGLCFALIPRGGALGAAWALLLSMTTACLLYFWFVFGVSESITIAGTIVRPLLAAAGMGGVIWIFRDVHTVLMMIVAILLYCVLLLAVGGLSLYDLQRVLRVAQRSWQLANSVLRRG